MKQWLVILIMGLPFLASAQAKDSKAVVNKAKATTPVKGKTAPQPKQTMALNPSISFKPDNIIVEVAPGTTLNEKIIVQNNLDIEYQAQVVFVPVVMTDAGVLIREETAKGKGKKKVKTTPLPYLKDIVIPEKVITIKAKQVTTIPVAFKIPQDAKGAYYFQYSVQPLNTELDKIKKEQRKKAGKNKTGAMLGVVVNVYSVGAITVKDRAQVDIASQIQLKYLTPTKQVMLQAKVSNKGNDFARSYEGTAVVTKGGQVVAKFSVKSVQQLTMLLPNSTQMFAGSVEAPLTKGDYDVVLTFKDFKGSKVSTFKETLKVN